MVEIGTQGIAGAAAKALKQNTLRVKKRFIGKHPGTRRPKLGLQLTPDLAALECCAVDVDVEAPVFKALKLSIV